MSMTNQQGAPEALRVEAAYGGDGKFIGYRLQSSGAPGGLLVWADQTVMSGFRIGDHFVPGYQEVIEYKPVALVAAQQPATHVQNPAEIAHVAGDVSKNGPESNMAQQPAPSAAVALSDDLRDRLVAISEAVADQDDRAAQAMLREILKAPQPSPTPQADSQPAPDPADVIAGALQTSRGHAMELMQQAVDADRAARATADSVTAPVYSIDADPQGIRARVAEAITGALAFGAQGANMPPFGHWLAPFWESARWEAIRAKPVHPSADTLYLLRRLLSNQHTLTGSEFRAELVKIVEAANDPATPAQAADSVLDAARLERERICAAIKAEDDYCVDQGDYMLDSDDCIKIVRGEWVRPDFSVDAARKQGCGT